MEFNKGDLYSRNDVWKKYHPNKGDKPKGGNWDTGYTSEGEELLAFLNIGSPGRTGHDFANQYDSDTETLTWFGKTDSHSKQPIFKQLIEGKLRPHFFARWDSSNTKFIYLGTGQILSFEDEYPIENNKKAIKLNIQITENSLTVGPNGIISNSSLNTPNFGKKVTVLVNKYERDPLKRLQCIEFFGSNCQICGFNFVEKYGLIGENFCHVHHIEPLGEVGGEHDIDPTKDLIPVCPNCHAMLHRTKPSMKPDVLVKIIGHKN